MNYKYISCHLPRIGALVLAGMISIPLSSANIFANNTGMVDGQSTEKTSSTSELASYLNKHSDDSRYQATVAINTKTGTATEAQSKTSLKKALHISKTKADQLTNKSSEENKREITNYLKTKGIYEYTTDTHHVYVTAPYQIRRIYVQTSQAISDSYGAKDSIYSLPPLLSRASPGEPPIWDCQG